jgi:hypothetical protein
MATNYRCIQDFLTDANEGDIFIPLAGSDDFYYCVEDPSIEIGIETILAYLDVYFEAVPQITCCDKVAAIARKLYDLIPWTAIVGDYFTTYENNVALYRIIEDAGDNCGYKLISGGTYTGDTLYAAKAGFEDDRVQVTFETGSGSGSASGSSSV